MNDSTQSELRTAMHLAAQEVSDTPGQPHLTFEEGPKASVTCVGILLWDEEENSIPQEEVPGTFVSFTLTTHREYVDYLKLRAFETLHLGYQLPGTMYERITAHRDRIEKLEDEDRALMSKVMPSLSEAIGKAGPTYITGEADYTVDSEAAFDPQWSTKVLGKTTILDACTGGWVGGRIPMMFGESTGKGPWFPDLAVIPDTISDCEAGTAVMLAELDDTEAKATREALARPGRMAQSNVTMSYISGPKRPLTEDEVVKKQEQHAVLSTAINVLNTVEEIGAAHSSDSKDIHYLVGSLGRSKEKLEEELERGLTRA